MTGTVEQGPAARDTGAGGVGWVTIGSLALNLLLVGTLLGGLLVGRPHHHRGGQDAPRSGGLTAFIATLPAARRDAIWEATRKQWEALRAMRKDARRARQTLDEALAAEPFDKARLMAAQAQVTEVESRLHGPMRALFAEIASHMTPDERRAYMKSKEQIQKRRPTWPPTEDGETKPGKPAP